MRTRVLLVVLLAASTAHADKLPIYSYAIQSEGYSAADAFTKPMQVRIPNTVWTCDFTFGLAHSLVLRCYAPPASANISVMARVSCASSDSNAQTLHLSTFDESKFAGIYIGCRKDFDDGF